MNTAQIAINGYGTIGKRIASAVELQPDMQVCGVAKTSPDYEANAARANGYPLYVASERSVEAFGEAGIDVAGTVEALIEACDVVVDATPSGVGKRYKARYDAADTPAIFQGGEAPEVAEQSFNARSNFEDCAGADSLRVVSCNTTGLTRFLSPLKEAYGIEKVRATLVRRGGDPSQSDRGPINDILPDPVSIPSHHGPDVQTVFPDLDIDTMGLKVPSTRMHVHTINVTLSEEPALRAITDQLSGESRLFVVPARLGTNGCGTLHEFAREMGRSRGDLYENCIWGESLALNGRDLYCYQAIHQESDVVPENIDAIRAITESASATESRALTDEALGIGILESVARMDRTETMLAD